MNSDIANNENVDLWSIGKCIFCKEKVEEDSKILKCLHIICKDCAKRESTNLGVLCKCKIVTKGDLIDYSILPPNQSRVKMCSGKKCRVIAKKICMHCKSMYCKPCSELHSITNQDHSPFLMMSYPLKKEFVSCPKCMEKCVEVFCTKCSKMICSLCHLNFHRTHDFKLLSSMATETKEELKNLLTCISKNNNDLNCLIEFSNENIKKVKSEKEKINDKINERIKMLHLEVEKHGFELKKKLETNFTDAVSDMNMNIMVVNDLKNKNEYYHSLTSSVINHNKTFEYIKLSKIIMDQLAIACRHTKDMSKESTIFKAELIYNDEQSMNKCVKSIQETGGIISSKIVCLSAFKTRVDSNNVFQTLENDLPTMIKPNMIKLGKRKRRLAAESIRMITNYNDSGASDYEPIVTCSCCSHWTEELVVCTVCNRAYHNDCHIPPLAKELKPTDPSLKSWKCTICQDITIHIGNLRQKKITGHNSISTSERKVIERILMELYCQKDDSDHYRDCLDRELYPMYYEQIADPISLNNIKQRLESNAVYTSLLGIIKDIKKVLANGKSYYCLTHPCHTSAHQLQVSLERMIFSWLPSLYRASRE